MVSTIFTRSHKRRSLRLSICSQPTIVSPNRYTSETTVLILILDLGFSLNSAITQHIRERIGKNPTILAPIFRDTNTDSLDDEPFRGFVHMDTVSFGMGCASMQLTLSMRNLEFATFMYDQLAAINPILNALSANAPIHKGKLTAIDSRFFVLEKAMDDRTSEERDPKSANYIYKSRYSSVYSFISESPMVHDFHNDYDKLPFDKDFFNRLLEETSVGPRLAEHIANLFVRDPLVIFDEHLETLDENDIAHFLNFQSTNWNCLRFKFPTHDDEVKCFKIEVRSMDMMFTPKENAAFCTFVILLIKAFKKFSLNFVTPISKISENFERAMVIDAVNKEKFHWFIGGISEDMENSIWDDKFNLTEEIKDRYGDMSQEDFEKMTKELSIHEIINGCEDYFGLIPMLKTYVEKHEEVVEKKKIYYEHLDFVSKRASGQLMTGAKFQRNFVQNHEDYKNDSVVSEVND